MSEERPATTASAGGRNATEVVPPRPERGQPIDGRRTDNAPKQHVQQVEAAEQFIDAMNGLNQMIHAATSRRRDLKAALSEVDMAAKRVAGTKLKGLALAAQACADDLKVLSRPGHSGRYGEQDLQENRALFEMEVAFITVREVENALRSGRPPGPEADRIGTATERIRNTRLSEPNNQQRQKTLLRRATEIRNKLALIAAETSLKRVTVELTGTLNSDARSISDVAHAYERFEAAEDGLFRAQAAIAGEDSDMPGYARAPVAQDAQLWLEHPVQRLALATEAVASAELALESHLSGSHGSDPAEVERLLGRQTNANEQLKLSASALLEHATDSLEQSNRSLRVLLGSEGPQNPQEVKQLLETHRKAVDQLHQAEAVLSPHRKRSPVDMPDANRAIKWLAERESHEFIGDHTHLLADEARATSRMEYAVRRAADHQAGQWENTEFKHQSETLSTDGFWLNPSVPDDMRPGGSGSGRVGWTSARGDRPTMEDAHLHERLTFVSGNQQVTAHVTAVFDGHGGSDTAGYLSAQLGARLEENLRRFNPNQVTDLGVYNAMRQSMIELDAGAKASIQDDSGSTANVALQIENNLYVANLGDSRAVLVDGDGTTTQLTEDQSVKHDIEAAKQGRGANRGSPATAALGVSPDNPSRPLGYLERRAIKEGGTYFEHLGRRAGPRLASKDLLNRGRGSLLAVARAVGDASTPGVSARCKVAKVQLETGQRYRLVQACDGVFDVASSNQVGRLVHLTNQLGWDSKTASEALVRAAYAAGSKDNITAMVTDVGGEA